jgi:putative membrane protein
MYHNFVFGGMWFGWIFWIILIVLVVWLIVNQSNKSKQNFQPQQQTESALEILKKRYAKGEISKEQYEQMKKDII